MVAINVPAALQLARVISQLQDVLAWWPNILSTEFRITLFAFSPALSFAKKSHRANSLYTVVKFFMFLISFRIGTNFLHAVKQPKILCEK